MEDRYQDMVKSVFSGPDGETLRKYWHQIYTERISYTPGQDPEETAFREGQRSIIQSIEDILNG